MSRLVDALLSAAVAGVGCLLVMLLGLALRGVRRLGLLLGPRRRRGGRRIVYLGTGRIAQVFPRNGVNLFLERECSDFDGYFEQMWNVHFPAGARGRLDLTPRHHLIDVDFCLPAQAARLRLTATAWREVRFLLWLLPFLVRSRASIVTATNPYLQGLNAALASRLLGLPYAVIITRDYDWDWTVLRKQAFSSVFPTRRLERAIGRWVLRHADLVLADREYYRQFAVRNGATASRAVATRVLADSAYAAARQHGPTPVQSATDHRAMPLTGAPDRGALPVTGDQDSRLTVIGAHGDGALPVTGSTRMAAPSVRERYGLGCGPLLSYVGRLDGDKFALDLVECLGLVQRQVPDVVLACAGTGALSSQMLQRATELGIAPNLRLLGSLDLADLPALVASSDVFVAPHMGYTLIEAGLTGVPIVTYDYDFHSEIIQDGETGYLVPLRDVRALAQRVVALLADPPAARAVGDRLRQKLLREHSLEAVVPLYRAAYDRTLGSGRRA